MSQSFSEKQIEFLRRRQFAHVATVNPDGSPQVTALWVDTDGLAVMMNTAKGRVKHRNLLLDPRIAVSIVDSADPYSTLTVSGRAELIESGALEHIRSLRQKYHGDPDFVVAPGEERVIIRVVPDRIGGDVS